MREAYDDSETGYGSLIANPYARRLFKTSTTHIFLATLDGILPTQSCQDSSSGQVQRATYDDLFAIARFVEETRYGERLKGASEATDNPGPHMGRNLYRLYY
jgi:hypothetical protein